MPIGEQVEIGSSRPEVDHHRSVRGRSAVGSAPTGGGRVDDGAGAGPGSQVALGEQLVVGGDDDAAGDTEIRCGRAWRRAAFRR
jgi:hypothetical protein